MAALRLTLPVLQNWDCHNCAGCCRQHEIEITADERQRILDQGWTDSDGIPGGVTIRQQGGWLSAPRYFLAHQADGACVFLNEQGLCRIHARFGEMGKPLACRVYPYAFHPAGKSVAVSLRFSCPSVVSNAGRPVSHQVLDIRRIAEQVVPAGAASIPAPAVNATSRVDWSDFWPFHEALDATLAQPDKPLLLRLLESVVWTGLVGQSSFEKLRGGRIREFLELILQAAPAEALRLGQSQDPVTRLGEVYFRMLVAQYARKDTASDVHSGWSGRWRLLQAIWKFSRGTGLAPPLQEGFRPVPFAVLQTPSCVPAGTDELFTRYFRVKVQGLHYCGPAYYHVPFVEGFQSLVLMLPVTLWLARWLAASDGREQPGDQDVARALAIADHHHGFSPALGQPAARSRVRSFAQSGDLVRLLVRDWA